VLCREHGIYHISDEAYEYFTYGQARHFSPGSLPGAEAHTISLYSLSKAYGFAGWRVGYMAYPQHLEAAMTKIQDTVLICPPISSQVAAAAALGVGRAYCEPYLKELAEVRELVLSRLATLAPRVKVPVAEGAFYCFVKVSPSLGRGSSISPSLGRGQGEGLDPMTLAERLIKDHKVAVLPGMTFGIEGCYLRIAYGALKKETVAEGMGRLVKGLEACL
jgi:aspartate/methionine/tyrosine aminotransferase